MATVLFIFDRVKTPIKCRKEDKLKDICYKFTTIDINSLNFIYSGKELDLELTFNEQANIIDRNRNEMIILVEEKNHKKNINKSKEIICPTCKENCRISIQNYKIKLYECKNGHELNNILLDEYNNTQNINESNITCNNCNKIHNNKIDIKEDTFYKCLSCKQNICPSCKSIHNDKHKIINYDNKNCICDIHNNTYDSYCKDCNKNLCTSCDNIHNKKHKIINYKYIIKNEDEIKQKMNIFRKKIDKLNTNIKDIIRILNKVMENIETYYTINYDILNNYDKLNKNYYRLQNINDILKNVEFNDIDEIIKECDICNKFQKIFDLYKKMNISDNTINNKNNEKTNEIKIKYKI